MLKNSNKLIIKIQYIRYNNEWESQINILNLKLTKAHKVI